MSVNDPYRKSEGVGLRIMILIKYECRPNKTRILTEFTNVTSSRKHNTLAWMYTMHYSTSSVANSTHPHHSTPFFIGKRLTTSVPKCI